jgi:ribosomal protein L40E
MPRYICDRCGATIPPHAHYVVKMQVYADPTLPPITSDDLEEADHDRRMADLLEEMQDLSEEQLEAAVHWERDFRICRPCQLDLFRNPLGAPPLTNPED